jgi:hypothetical protein
LYTIWEASDQEAIPSMRLKVSVKECPVEVPAGEPSGGMEIQVLSNPWFVFAVPADYQFTSVELKYSK